MRGTGAGGHGRRWVYFGDAVKVVSAARDEQLPGLEAELSRKIMESLCHVFLSYQSWVNGQGADIDAI